MKKQFVLFIFILSLSGFEAAAQRSIIKADFLKPLGGIFEMGFERTNKAENQSWGINMQFYGDDNGDYDRSGFAIGPEYRYYLSEKPAPAGVHLGAFAGYVSLKEKYFFDEEEDHFNGGVVGLKIGYQWYFKDRITINVFGGPGIIFGPDNTLSYGIGNGRFLRAGFTVGARLGK